MPSETLNWHRFFGLILMDAWALKELVGHYVNYRKQVSPTMQELLPEGQFRLYAVTARFPQKLAEQVELTLIQPGVYECRWGTDVIRIVALRQLPQSENNALLHLFSARREARTQFRCLPATFAQRLAALAYKKQSAGQDEAAVGLYCEALDLDGRNAGNWFNLGIAYQKLGRGEGAARAYERAAARAPEDEKMRAGLEASRGPAK